MSDLEETMHFDPEDGIADLDAHLDRLKHVGRSPGLQVRPPCRAQRASGGDLRQAPRGDRAAVLSPTGAMAIEVKPRLGGEREAQQSVGDGHQRRGFDADRANDFRMMGVEPAGQRSERRHDDLGRRSDEAAPRHAPAAQVARRSLGWKWPEISGRGSPRTASWRRTIPPSSTSSAIRPPQWSAKPGSWLPTIQVQSRRDVSDGQQLAGARQAAGRSRSGRGSCRRGNRGVVAPVRSTSVGERGQRGMRIIRRQELPEPGEPARFFEVQVGDQQRLRAGQKSAPSGGRRERFACERKGNHEASCNAGPLQSI